MRKILRNRLYRQILINESNHCCLAARFHYLQYLLPNSITSKFRVFYVYRQIPLLAYSNNVTFTAKPLPANSLPPAKFDYTVKVQYVQIPGELIYCQHPLGLYLHYITYKFIIPFYPFIITVVQ